MPTELLNWLQATKALLQAYPWMFFVLAGVVLLYQFRGKLTAKLKPESSGLLRRVGGKALAVAKGTWRVARQVSPSVWVLVLLGVVSMAPWKGCDINWPSIPAVKVDGPRTVVILHETAEMTPELSQAFVALRSGANADYLKSKHHSLLILDDDAKTTSGEPVPMVTSLKEQGVSLPSVFVLDGKKVVAKKQLTGGAAEVMELLKGAGG